MFTYSTSNFITAFLQIPPLPYSLHKLPTAGGRDKQNSCQNGGGYKVTSVWEHKTVATHGPAMVVLNERVYDLLVKYVGSDKEDTDLVFTTQGGGRSITLLLS